MSWRCPAGGRGSVSRLATAAKADCISCRLEGEGRRLYHGTRTSTAMQRWSLDEQSTCKAPPARGGTAAGAGKHTRKRSCRHRRQMWSGGQWRVAARAEWGQRQGVSGAARGAVGASGGGLLQRERRLLQQHALVVDCGHLDGGELLDRPVDAVLGALDVRDLPQLLNVRDVDVGNELLRLGVGCLAVICLASPPLGLVVI